MVIETCPDPTARVTQPARETPSAAVLAVAVKDYPASRGHALRAIDGVSLRLRAGQVTGLVGPNRAGKSTLVRLLLGLTRPTSGTVERLGRPAHDHSTLSRVGYAHEQPAFPRYRSARGVLNFHAALAGLDPATSRDRIGWLLCKVGLADRADEPSGRFSKGMAQRLALALALLNDPELLVLDEPAEGLDQGGRRLVEDLIDETRSRGRTVLLVSHQFPDVERLCDRLAVLVGGRLAAEGTVDDVRHSAGGRGDLARAFESIVASGG